MRDFSELDSLIRSHSEKGYFSGAVLLAERGEILFKKAYGYADRRFNVPNQVDTKFNIGSLNKLFTEVSITQLDEQGKLDLETFISEYLPDYPKSVAEKVNINHLLSHTSGLGHYWNEKFRASIGNLRKVDDFISLFVDDPLSFPPGERVQYSNAGFVLLGKIIENISGLDYYDYVREHIYLPLRMRDTDHFELDHPVPNLATGYTRMYPGGHESKDWRSNEYLIGTKGSPAGGGYSTVEDLHKFDIAVNTGTLPGSSILRNVKPRRQENDKPSIITRAGGAPGTAALYERYPEQDITAIVLSNMDPVDIQNRKIVSIHDDIRDMILR